MEPKTFRGLTLAEVERKVRAELGDDAVVVRQREGLTGGVGGFFQRKLYEVEAIAGPAGAAAPAAAAEAPVAAAALGAARAAEAPVAAAAPAAAVEAPDAAPDPMLAPIFADSLKSALEPE